MASPKGSHFGLRRYTNLRSPFSFDGSGPEALTTWVVGTDLPPHPGFGLRRPPPSWKALRGPRACRDYSHRASNETVGSGSEEPRIETRVGESGHANQDSARTAVGGAVSDGLFANRDTAASGNAESGHASEPDPWAGRRASLRGHIARARSFQELIDGHVVRNAAEVAGREGLTRARVSQLLRLLKLVPDVLADLEEVDGVGPVPTETQLRNLVSVKSPERQFAQYHRMCAVEGERRAPVRGTRGRPPQKGFLHLFERARCYHARMEAGEFRSLEALGEAEGVSGRRISQILRLLHLEPEIIAAVEVPADKVPKGVTERRLREVSKLVGREEQLAAWNLLTEAVHPPRDRC